MFAGLHLKYKIFLGFLLVASFAVVVGGVNYTYLQTVLTKYEHVVTVNMGNSTRLEGLKGAAYAMRSKFYFLIGFTKGNPDLSKSLLRQIADEKKKFLTLDHEYKSVPFVEGEEALYHTVSEIGKRLINAHELVIEAFEKEGFSDHLNEVLNKKYSPVSLEYVVAIDKLIEFQQLESKKWVSDSHDSAAASTKVSIVILIISLVSSICIALLLVKRLTSSLENVINDLRNSSPKLSSSAQDMTSLSSELSSCATEQAASVQETASSLEEISAMIRRNTDNAVKAKTSSSKSREAVRNGQQSVQNMMHAMDEINHNNDAFNAFMNKNSHELNEMVKVITNISEKTKVIHDIVFQTKLLSFNASVEAARSGEHGKGFAVVAEEVGNLAEMSGSAANDIKALLEESISKVNEIVTTTKQQVDQLVKEGKDKVKLGLERAKDCDIALHQITNSVTIVEELVEEVAHASSEQSQGLSEINKAMSKIDEVTHQNTTASQSVSANASDVLNLSLTIKKTSDDLVSLLIGSNKEAS